MINRIKDESFDESFAEEAKFPITTAAKLTFDAHLVRAPSRATLVRWIRKGKYGINLQARRPKVRTQETAPRPRFGRTGPTWNVGSEPNFRIAVSGGPEVAYLAITVWKLP